jgi:hypothetical protein
MFCPSISAAESSLDRQSRSGSKRGSSRRSFLNQLGTGLGAVALQAMLQENGKAQSPQLKSPILGDRQIDPLNPYSQRSTDFPATAKSVIFLFMVGGPSQVDTFDYKPLLQKLDGKKVPDSIRQPVLESKHANVFHGCKEELMASPYRWKRSGQSGRWVSELFPAMSEHIDDLCLIHSMQADSNNHAPASYQLHTGDVRSGKASLGSWVTYGLGSENQDLPGYVVLFDAGPLGGAANYSNGFLPPAFQPTRLRDQGSTLLDLLPAESYASGQRASLDLIRQLNLEHRQRTGVFTSLDARIASYELAYRMQSSAVEVGAWGDETASMLTSYGIDAPDERTQSFGRKCLMARRLVERGVRFVQLYDMPDKDGWDAHDKLTNNHNPRARWTDRPIAGLLADLKQRGLLDSTLVIWASEFGRTPMMQGTNGRQHNAAGFTLWMAGGGIKPGISLGATDEIGLMAVDRQIQFRDLHATILTALGLSYEDLFVDINGRQERITGVAGSAKPIWDILRHSPPRSS